MIQRLQNEYDSMHDRRFAAYCIEAIPRNFPYIYTEPPVNQRDIERLALLTRLGLLTHTENSYSLSNLGKQYFAGINSSGMPRFCFGKVFIDSAISQRINTSKETNSSSPGKNWLLINYSFHIGEIPQWAKDQEVLAMLGDKTLFYDGRSIPASIRVNGNDDRYVASVITVRMGPTENDPQFLISLDDLHYLLDSLITTQ